MVWKTGYAFCNVEEKRSAVQVPQLETETEMEPPLIEEVSTIDGQVSVSKDGTITIYRNGKSSTLEGER